MQAPDIHPHRGAETSLDTAHTRVCGTISYVTAYLKRT